MRALCSAAAAGISFALLTTEVWSQTEHSFEGAALLYLFDYNEELPAPLKSSETGWLPGFRLAYAYQGISLPMYGSLVFEYTRAKTDYDGTTQLGAPVQLQSKHKLTRGEVDVGYSFNTIGGSRFSLTPYAGVGYRSWERLLGDADPRGLREVYTWWYAPLGVRVGYHVAKDTDVLFDVSIRLMFAGQIQFDFGASDPSYNSPLADLGSRVGWRAYLPVAYRFTRWLSINAGSWYEYSSIGESNSVIITASGVPQATFQEPMSATHQFGFDLALVLHF